MKSCPICCSTNLSEYTAADINRTEMVLCEDCKYYNQKNVWDNGNPDYRAADIRWLRRVRELEAEFDRLTAINAELLAALEGIQDYAQDYIDDIAEDVQEGGGWRPEGRREYKRWNAVITAIAKAKGGA